MMVPSRAGRHSRQSDAKGSRWVLTPFWGPKHPQYKYPIEHGPVTHGAIAAFKVVEKGKKFALEPAWLSRVRAQPGFFELE